MLFNAVLSAAVLVAGANAAAIDARAAAASTLHGPFALDVKVSNDATNMQPFDDKNMGVGPSSLNPTDRPKPLLPTTVDFIINQPLKTFYIDEATGSVYYKDAANKNAVMSAVKASDGTLFFGTDAQIKAAGVSKDTGYKYNKSTKAVTHGTDNIWACNYVVNDFAPKDAPENTRIVRQSGWPYIVVAKSKPTNSGSNCFKAAMKMV